MLARMGVAFDLAPKAPGSRDARVLRDLYVARSGLIKDRTRLRNRAQTQDIAVLKRQTKARLAQVDRQIVELDAGIAALIETRETTARSRDILCSMPGIGAVTAAALLTLLPEIGTLARKQVASSRWPRTDHPSVWSMAGQVVHRRRAQTTARRPLHAGAGRNALQPRSQGQIRSPASRGKARQGCHAPAGEDLTLLGSPAAGYACSFATSGRPNEETADAEDREALRLRASGLSTREIAASLGVGQTTASDYLKRVPEAGLAWPLPEDLTDAALEALLLQPVGRPTRLSGPAGLAGDPPRTAPEGRDAVAVVGGVPGGPSRRLRLQPVLRPLPRLEGRSPRPCARPTLPARKCSSITPAPRWT